MNKLSLIKTFSTICETKDIALSANKLSMSESDIYNHISLLEEIIHTKLIQHSKNNFNLTNAGETFLVFAHTLLMKNHKNMIKLTDHDQIFPIRIGMPTDYIEIYLKTYLINFIKIFTNIELNIDTDVSGNLFKRLDNQEFDLILATHWQQQTGATLLYERRFHWVAAKNGISHQQQPRPIALYPENCPIRVQVFAHYQIGMPLLNIVLTSPSPHALCQVVESDLAIAPIAEFRINDNMMILDPSEYQLPPLPAFNESIYVATPDSAAVNFLSDLFQAIKH